MTYGFPSSVFPLLLPYSLSCAGCKEDKINTVMILIVSLHLMDFVQGGLSGPVCVSAFITIQSGHHIWWEKPGQASRQCGGELSICLEIHRILPLSTELRGDSASQGKAVKCSVWGLGFGDRWLPVQILLQMSRLLGPQCPSVKWEQSLFYGTVVSSNEIM